MRIAFDHQIFGWQEYGGISRYSLELAMALSSYCCQEVGIVCPLYINRYLDEAPAGLLLNGRRVPVFRRSGRIYRLLNSVLAAPTMRRFRPDIVHETYFSKRPSAPRGAATVLTVYDMIHERFPENFSPADPTRSEKAAAVCRADHVICISEQTRTDLIELLDVSPEKTSVVHLGFSLSRSADMPAGGCCKLAERPFLLYVGQRAGYKNFEGLLRAYAGSLRLRADFDLVCFGGGPFTTKELDLMSSLGAHQANVRQMSGDDALLESYYRNALAFIYPSRYEGFGIPPLEAMSFGCPVVCSNVSSIPEVVGEAAESFDPTSVESIRTSIERVVDDEGWRRELIQRGAVRHKAFSWNRCGEETLQIYRKVLA